MTFPTFNTKYVAGLRRLWYLKYKGKVEFPPSLEFEIGLRKQDASECLPPSQVTVAVGWAESVFLIEALPQGADDFFDNAFIIAGNSEVAKRIGVWEDLVYGDLVSIRRLEDDFMKRLKEVAIYLRLSSGRARAIRGRRAWK